MADTRRLARIGISVAFVMSSILWFFDLWANNRGMLVAIPVVSIISYISLRVLGLAKGKLGEFEGAKVSKKADFHERAFLVVYAIALAISIPLLLYIYAFVPPYKNEGAFILLVWALAYFVSYTVGFILARKEEKGEYQTDVITAVGCAGLFFVTLQVISRLGTGISGWVGEALLYGPVILWWLVLLARRINSLIGEIKQAEK